jgi:hypothetical protein
MKKFFAAFILFLSGCLMTHTSFAQSAPPESTTKPATTIRESKVDALELATAILKVLAAAPNDFKEVSGDLYVKENYRNWHHGLINLSTAPSSSLIPSSEAYYILPILDKVDKKELSPSAILTGKVLQRVLGAGTVETKDPDEFTVSYNYKNSSRPEWIRMVIHPMGHLTLFIYKK